MSIRRSILVGLARPLDKIWIILSKSECTNSIGVSILIYSESFYTNKNFHHRLSHSTCFWMRVLQCFHVKLKVSAGLLGFGWR